MENKPYRWCLKCRRYSNADEEIYYDDVDTIYKKHTCRSCGDIRFTVYTLDIYQLDIPVAPEGKFHKIT